MKAIKAAVRSPLSQLHCTYGSSSIVFLVGRLQLQIIYDYGKHSKHNVRTGISFYSAHKCNKGGSMMQVARDDADAAISGHTRCHGCCNCVGPMVARYPYAWMVRESHVTFFQQQLLSGCAGNRYCLQADGVLRISMTMFLFFAFMTLSTMFTRKLEDFRSFWHSQWWVVKTALLVICTLVISTLAPADWIQLYANVAPFGAGVFIFIQLISVIRYITRLNYKLCLTNFEQRYAEVITVSILAYNVSTVGGIFMIFWYIDNWFNIVLIGTTLLVVYVMLLIGLKSKAKRRYMEPWLVGVYIGFLSLSAIRSWNMDVGWMCTWVHIVNEGLAVISIEAILLAPINRIVWLQQLLGRIFGIGCQQQGSDESQGTDGY